MLTRLTHIIRSVFAPRPKCPMALWWVQVVLCLPLVLAACNTTSPNVVPPDYWDKVPHEKRTPAEEEAAPDPTLPEGARRESRRNNYPDGAARTVWGVVIDAEGKTFRHGRFTRYHANGRTAVQGLYRMNHAVGVWTWFDENGQLLRRVRQMGDYEDVLAGKGWENPHTVYRSVEGRKVAEGIIKQGRPHGEWRYYYKFGGLRALGSFVGGTHDGRWVFYFANGQVERREEYHIGVLHGHYMRGYRNGQESVEGRMEQGLRVGPWRHWFENGQLEAAGDYVEDQRHGRWRFYDEWGNLVRDLRYSHGQVAEEIALPQPKTRELVVPRPEAMPFRPRLFGQDGGEIRYQGLVPEGGEPPAGMGGEKDAGMRGNTRERQAR